MATHSLLGPLNSRGTVFFIVSDSIGCNNPAFWKFAKLQASTDDFECLKCLDIERKKAKLEKLEINRDEYTQSTYYQLQTRSADEPMTTFVSCLKCATRWKC